MPRNREIEKAVKVFIILPNDRSGGEQRCVSSVCSRCGLGIPLPRVLLPQPTCLIVPDYPSILNLVGVAILVVLDSEAIAGNEVVEQVLGALIEGVHVGEQIPDTGRVRLTLSP